MELKGKIVVITGGSSGIGQNLVKHFYNQGCTVVTTFNNNQKGITETVKGIDREVFTYKVDLRKRLDIEKFVSYLSNNFDNVDVLINNAGVGNDCKGFVEQTYLEMEEMLQINLVGTMYLTKLIYKAFWLKNNNGKVINTSSIRGLEYAGNPSSLVYATSKSGINSFTKTLARLWAPNILVNAVAPGFTRVARMESFDEEIKKGLIDQTLLKRFVEPDELAESYIFLAKSDVITGQTLYVDAGFSLK